MFDADTFHPRTEFFRFTPLGEVDSELPGGFSGRPARLDAACQGGTIARGCLALSNPAKHRIATNLVFSRTRRRYSCICVGRNACCNPSPCISKGFQSWS